MMFLSNYGSIFFFFFVSIILSVIVFGIPYLLSAKTNDKEKLSSYECGFNPFKDSRSEFDVKFYLVAILFLIFDLEISFLFPFVMSLDLLNIVGIGSMFFFLIVLTIGFYYEWKKGALDWE
uniref:NADH dehydrogenase subunit 3 n=1 Tax=Isochrysis galbana TaxID=37099 RepID=UPI0021B61653|nr:NADH dehydrogenase subunit 3 [Isochrysis galbana]UWI54143.1 NADH dehydrogenase subunit 3 [Isochrysis galbana]